VIHPVTLERVADTTTDGWNKLRITCWHGRQLVVRGIPSVVDGYAWRAGLNPCKVVGCPNRARPKEEQ